MRGFSQSEWSTGIRTFVLDVAETIRQLIGTYREELRRAGMDERSLHGGGSSSRGERGWGFDYEGSGAASGVGLLDHFVHPILAERAGDDDAVWGGG